MDLQNQPSPVEPSLVVEPQWNTTKQPEKTWKWKNILYIILWIILWIYLTWAFIIFYLHKWAGKIFGSGNSTSSICIDQSWLYELNGYASFGNYTQYILSRASDSYTETSSINDDITFTLDYRLWLSSNEYGWLDSLYMFHEYVYLDLIFSDGKIVDRKIINKKNKKDLWDLENINWLSVIWEKNIKYYSKLKKWDTINLTDSVFLYNDTDKTQTFIIEDTRWKEKEAKINAWEFYNWKNSFWETIKI